MREANWDEIFQKRTPVEDGAPRSQGFVPWEDWLTFGILAIAFMSVVHSIDSAGWVDDMPSLYPIGFSGLLVGYVLSRIRQPELLLHAAALAAGAGLVYVQLIAILPGSSIVDRTDQLIERMRFWWTAVTQGGISTDTLPFIVLVLALVWLGAYFSSWAIFRWRNAWLGLVPGGVALMWNISFIPGQFSYAFVVFLFAAVLLLMRVHVSHKESEWSRDGVRYPEFISLSVLHITFWVALGLLALVMAAPLAERSDSASERWGALTAPLTDRLTPLARVFISVDAKRPIDVHNLKDALPLQGKIKLNQRDAVQIDVEITPEMAAFLRAQSFDEYTSNGWKLNIEDEMPLPPGERTGVTAQDEVGARQEITITARVTGDGDDVLFSLGQPVQSSQEAKVNLGADPTDITGVKPRGDLDVGDEYTVTGSVSLATVDQLRAAGTAYPVWVSERYLQVPDDLPERVAGKAAELTASADNPYDAAAAIERYLRTFPTEFDVPETPPGRDGVDFFLFDVQAGYFDYHASAMAVMLRTLGIPSRVAIGYALDSTAFDLDTGAWQLTERNAYAWPEVYFPGIGWVEFSPAPAQPLIQRPGAPVADGEDRQPDAGEGDAPVEPPIDLGIDRADRDSGVDATVREDAGSSAWPALITLAVIGGLAALTVFGARFAWEYGLGALPRPAQAWEKTQRLARWGSAGAQPSETPREFAVRLADEVPGASGATYLAAAYERSRFGHKDLTDEEAERLDAAWSDVRNSLLRRVLRLKPRGE